MASDSGMHGWSLSYGTYSGIVTVPMATQFIGEFNPKSKTAECYLAEFVCCETFLVKTLVNCFPHCVWYSE